MYFTAGIAVLMNTHHKNRLGIKDNLLPVGKIGNFYIGRAGGQIVVAVPGPQDFCNIIFRTRPDI